MQGSESVCVWVLAQCMYGVVCVCVCVCESECSLAGDPQSDECQSPGRLVIG